MPIRVKSRAQRPSELDVRTPSPLRRHPRFAAPVPAPAPAVELPDISEDDSFRVVVKKLSIYIANVILLPSTFEQLRTTAAGDGLRVLVDHLALTCTHPAIVNALLALKWHYGSLNEDKGLNEARANGCEIVAWRFLTHLSEREAVDYCLYEIPDPKCIEDRSATDEEDAAAAAAVATERSSLLGHARNGAAACSSSRRSPVQPGSNKRSLLLQSLSRLTMSMTSEDGDEDEDEGQREEEEEEEDPTAHFTNLNALEIAAIADAKRFLSQPVVQKIVTGLWNGDIVFWDTLAVHSVKKPRFYDPATADPFSRLRVPKYLKSFEVLFFAAFLFLYYAVLMERHPTRVTALEVLLYFWLAAFAYDELGAWIDAGSVLYATDVWNSFDMVMIGIGAMFLVLRIVGLKTNNPRLVDLAFDVLSLEALFMVPRVFSILSLSPYWGTLIPCLKEMGKDFLKFMVLVVVIYLGFLTTFSLVGRDAYPLRDMTWFLTKIFFGSSATGFDIMRHIDPIFGPPLMLLFVMLSSILLTGSLTGMLSNSFSRVIAHAREEYLYVYSVYVLEASTSNRLTHFYPPFNLLALALCRPLRLLLPLPAHRSLRPARILLLKATHLPIVAAILLYERLRRRNLPSASASNAAAAAAQYGAASARVPRTHPHDRHHRHQNSPSSSVSATRPRRPPASLSIPAAGADLGLAHLAPPLSPVAAATAAAAAAAATARLQRAADGGGGEEEGGDAPLPPAPPPPDTHLLSSSAVVVDVEGRIAELARKIDRLTELVVALHARQAGGGGD